MAIHRSTTNLLSPISPVSFYFSGGAVSGPELKIITINTIRKLISIGVKVRFIVCDQGPTNQYLFRLLGVTIEKPYFDLDLEPDNSIRIFALFDTPHLFKALRNNFINYPLSFKDFELNSHIAYWGFIARSFDIDRKNSIQIFPKLTASHIQPTSFDKMKVSYATQIFSNSVSSGMKVLINRNSLGQEALGTSILAGLFNDLFDLLNNRECSDCNYLKLNNQNFSKLSKFFNLLSEFKFQSDANINCINNLRLTISSILKFTEYVSDRQNYVLTGLLNQDSLENLFSRFRFYACENGNLRPEVFRRVFRTFCLTTYFQTRLSIRSNCKDDSDLFISPIKINRRPPLVQDHFDLVAEELEFLEINVCPLLDNPDFDVVGYISGFLLRKLIKLLCSHCFGQLQSDEANGFGHKLLEFKQYKGGKLIVPSLKFAMYIEQAIYLFFSNIDKAMFRKDAKNSICSKFLLEIEPIFIDGCVEDCNSKLPAKCISLVFSIMIKHHLKKFNSELTTKSNKTKQILKSKF